MKSIPQPGYNITPWGNTSSQARSLKVFISVSKAEHASSMGPTLKLHVIEEEEGQTSLQASCLVAIQAVEFL